MASDLGRVKFFKAALSSEEIADLQVTEREVAGFYLKESAYPPGFRIPKHSHANPSFILSFKELRQRFMEQSVGNVNL